MMTHASEAISGLKVQDNDYPETSQVSFGRNRYDLLHNENLKSLQQILHLMKSQSCEINVGNAWNYEVFLALLQEIEGIEKQDFELESLYASLRMLDRSDAFSVANLTISERNNSVLSIVKKAKENYTQANKVRRPKKRKQFSRSRYSSEDIREAGRAAIALSAGGAALGSLIAGIPGAIVGGVVGALVTFSGDATRYTGG